MITTTKLKIWTIISHALIVVGFGHGILTLGVVEVFWVPNIAKAGFTFSLNASFEARLPMVALTTLLGQLAIIYSIFNKKLAFHLLGLGFLWLSIIYFNVGISTDAYVHFAIWTAVPFFICTLIVFVTQPLKQLYRWVQNDPET